MKRFGFIPLILVVILGISGIYQVQKGRLHRPIRVEDVAAIELWPKESETRIPATPQEVADIVTWFNRASLVRNNPDHNGPGCGHASILIKLKSGERLDISRGLEAQRSGGIDYWFQQSNLERLITEIDQRRNEHRGC